MRKSSTSLLTTALAAILLAGPMVGPARADSSAEAHYKSGMALKNSGQDDQAIKEFEAAVGANPKHVMAWNSLGILYKKKGDLTRAVAAFEKAQQLSPK